MIGPVLPQDNQSLDSDDLQQPQLQLPTEQLPVSRYSQFYSRRAVPLSQNVRIPFEKTVVEVAVDSRGQRMATSSMDKYLRMYDFKGMKNTLNPFRTIEPFQNYYSKRIQYSYQGSLLLSIQGNNQLVLIDRDGYKTLQSVRGYNYIKDLNRTHGHQSAINDGNFHPHKFNELVTCSDDTTCRFWDTNKKLQVMEQQMSHVSFLKCLDQFNKPVKCSGVQFARDGTAVVVGCLDGSLQLFSCNRLHRPQTVIRNAHIRGSQFSRILCHKDQNKVVTRNADSSLKIWDLRHFSKPVFHQYNLHNSFPRGACSFSPDCSILMVGTVLQPQNETGCLYFYDMQDFQIKGKLQYPEQSVASAFWSQALNQIFVGTSKGLDIYYDRALSNKGILISIKQAPKQQHFEDQIKYRPVYNPNALDSMKQQMTNNFKKEIKRQRRQDGTVPQRPIMGPGRAGKTGNVTTITQCLIKSLNQAPIVQQNPQKQLTALDQIAKKYNAFQQVYKQTQPVKIFDSLLNETKAQEYLKHRGKICPHCGLKICTCKKKYIFQDK